MIRETSCDAVMIGRAASSNPWIFRQTADLLAGKVPRDATSLERRNLMLWHFGEIERLVSEPREALHTLRTMTGWYTHGLVNGKALRVRISELSTPAAFREAVEEFFDRPAAGVPAGAVEPARVSASS